MFFSLSKQFKINVVSPNILNYVRRSKANIPLGGSIVSREMSGIGGPRRSGFKSVQ